MDGLDKTLLIVVVPGSLLLPLLYLFTPLLAFADLLLRSGALGRDEILALYHDTDARLRRAAEEAILAMGRAVSRLRCVPDLILIDGNQIIPGASAARQEAIVDGDARVRSIAAASVLAKVTRDRLMIYFDRDFPQYGFAKHKGYGTLEHRRALAAHGPSPLHRRSFAPVKALAAESA